MLADASWWFVRGTVQLWTRGQDCLGEERRSPFGSSRWHPPPLRTGLWSQPGQKESLGDRPDSRAPFSCRDRRAQCVPGEFYWSKIIARKEKRAVGLPFIQNRHVFEDYGVFIKYTKELTI